MEVDRIRRRFTELSVRAAEEAAGLVRRLLDELAEQLGQPSVPDLGPAVIPDQLAVLVFDIYAAGGGSDLTERLTALRRSLP